MRTWPSKSTQWSKFVMILESSIRFKMMVSHCSNLYTRLLEENCSYQTISVMGEILAGFCLLSMFVCVGMRLYFDESTDEERMPIINKHWTVDYNKFKWYFWGHNEQSLMIEQDIVSKVAIWKFRHWLEVFGCKHGGRII